jgi:hypothetical protein
MLPPQHLLQSFRVTKFFVTTLETAMTPYATTKREVFGPHTRALLEERSNTLPESRRKLHKSQPELIALCSSLLILLNPILRTLQHLRQLPTRPIRLIPQHLIPITQPIGGIGADVPVILRHLVFLAALRIRRASRDDDIPVPLYRRGVRGILLVLARRLQQPLAEEIVDCIGEIKFLLRSIQPRERNLEDDNLCRMLLRKLHDLFRKVILIRILRALAEVIARVLSHAMDGDEFLV